MAFTFKANATGPTDYRFNSISEAMDKAEQLVTSGLYWMITICEDHREIMYWHHNNQCWEIAP